MHITFRDHSYNTKSGELTLPDKSFHKRNFGGWPIQEIITYITKVKRFNSVDFETKVNDFKDMLNNFATPLELERQLYKIQNLLPENSPLFKTLEQKVKKVSGL